VRLLLDTHILLWWLNADRRLSRPVRDLLAAEENDIAVSAATVWEVAIKRMLGRISVDLKELISAVNADHFVELPVRFAHSLTLESLPRRHDDLILEYAGIAGFDPLRA